MKKTKHLILKLLHFIGLTNLKDEWVDWYLEAAYGKKQT